MIKSLHIQNYQSHKDTEVIFSPNVTGIVGLNNHGKSAIVRTLQKVIRNVPEGTIFISDWADACIIAVTTEFGMVTRKVRSDGSSGANMYVVTPVLAEKSLEFAKFGIEVPIEALQVLSVSPIQEFGDVEFDLNFLDQLEPLFLVMGTGLPSIRGKVLGRITGVDLVGRAVQLAAAEEKKQLQEIKRQQGERESVAIQLKDYEGLNELAEQTRETAKLLKQLDSVQDRWGTLNELYTEIVSVIEHAQAAGAKAKALDLDIDDALARMVEIQKALGICQELEDIGERLVDLYPKIQVDIGILDDEFSDLEMGQRLIGLCQDLLGLQERMQASRPYAEVDVETIDFTRLQECANRLSALQRIDQEVVDVVAKWHAAIAADKEAESVVKHSQDELEVYKHEIGVCPTCERPF